MEINCNMLTKHCQRHNTEAVEASNQDNGETTATNMKTKTIKLHNVKEAAQSKGADTQKSLNAECDPKILGRTWAKAKQRTFIADAGCSLATSDNAKLRTGWTHK